ncbi:hypothetical protein JCM17039_10610 [Blautia glucerasea]
MGKMNKFLAAICTAGMLLSLSPAAVSAGEYTYTVTFDAGNQASMSGTTGLSVNNSATGSSYHIGIDSGKIVVSGLKIQDIVTFNPQAGAVDLADDSKYYVKGVRQSGRDNNSVASSSFRVTGDADYVVAYGVKGNMVGYTVNYQDENGRALAESRRYYGNVGDKPVVAHIYIENYEPQALALTRTLSSNEAENVFTFVYSEREVQVITRPGQTVTETVTENVTEPGTGTTGTTGTTDTEEGTAGTESETGTAETPAAPDTTTDTTGSQTAEPAGGNTAEPARIGGETTDIQEDDVPQANPDVVDLDEEETPLANMEIDKEEVKKGMPVAVGAGIAVAAAAGLGVLVWFLRKHKKA